MRIRHIVTTRCLSWGGSPPDYFSNNQLNSACEFVVTHFIPTLNNQSIKNFEAACILHDHIKDDRYSLPDIETSFNFYKVRMKSLNEDILSSWNNFDKIIVSRLDCDDYVNLNAVKQVQDIAIKNKSRVTIVGFNSGLKLLDGTDIVCNFQTCDYSGLGTMSVFQSVIYDTHTVNHNEFVNPNTWNYTRPNEVLKIKYDRIIIEDKNSFVYTRHSGSVSAASDEIKALEQNGTHVGRDLLSRIFGVKIFTS